MPNALVTGAGARIGRAIAFDLARRGWDVAVHYGTSHIGAEETAAAITALGRRAAVLKADLSSEAEVQTLVPRAVAALGQLTCLVNNASTFGHDDFGSATRATWDQHFEVNLRAPFVLTQAFAAQAPAPATTDQGEPRAQAVIINMIDQRVQRPTPDFATYTLSKAALWTMTQTSAQGLAPRVRVNAIGPGPTLQGGRQNAMQFEAQRRATILQRGPGLEEISAAVGYLLEAPSVTGQMLCVDGGQHLAWQTPDVVDKE